MENNEDKEMDVDSDEAIEREVKDLLEDAMRLGKAAMKRGDSREAMSWAITAKHLMFAYKGAKRRDLSDKDRRKIEVLKNNKALDESLKKIRMDIEDGTDSDNA